MTYSDCADSTFPRKSTPGTTLSKKKLLTSLFLGFHMEHFYIAEITVQLFHGVKIISQKV